MYYPFNHPNACGIDKKTGRFTESIIIEPELLFSLYWGNQYSMERIGEIFNCNHVCILKKMRKDNIPRRSLSQSQVISDTNTGRWVEKDSRLMGDQHPNWCGGISFEPYGIEFNSRLKKLIRGRDNHTCQECGMTEEELGYTLHCHHIDYNKENNSEGNLISLCRSCHAQTNFGRNDWKVYYKSKLNPML